MAKKERAVISEPFNPGQFRSCVGLSVLFVDQYTEEHDENVGLISCVDSKTVIKQRIFGKLLHNHAVLMSKLT